MTSYRRGMNIVAGLFEPVSVDRPWRVAAERFDGEDSPPFFQTSSYIKDRANRLNTAIQTFQKDVWRALPGSSEPISLAFGAWRIEWEKFYKKLSDMWLPSSADTDVIISYEKQLDDWKRKVSDAVRARGGNPDVITDPTRPQSPGEWPTWAKVALGVVGVGAGAAALYLGAKKGVPMLKAQFRKAG